MHFCFFLSDNNPDTFISLQITDHRNRVLQIPTSLRIDPQLWNPDKERPVNIYLKRLKKLNNKLDRLRIGITEYLQDVKDRKATFSLCAVARRIKKYLSEDVVIHGEGTLLGIMDNYICSRTHLITNSTYKRYMVFFRLLERYEGYLKKRLFIEEVNADFVKSFMDFANQEQYSNSTMIRTLHFVKTILNYLEKRGIRTYAYEVEIPKARTRQSMPISLDEAELATIAQAEVTEQFKAARDWLIISCYTGQRVSDFMKFTADHLVAVDQTSCLTFVQQKTQKSVLLPLHPAVRKILEANNGQFPRKLPYDTYNRQIKEVVHLAGIHQMISVRKRRGFRVSEALVPKWEAVSSHIGRRSFASNFYGKIPTSLLMEATGHSTEQMFQRYVTGGGARRAAELAQYFEQSHHKRRQAA